MYPGDFTFAAIRMFLVSQLESLMHCDGCRGCGILEQMYHLPRTYKRYKQGLRPTTICPFCDPAEIDYRLQEQTEHAYIMPNKVVYDVWEHHRVLDHLLLIPKRHVGVMNELNDAELLDIARLMAKYEAAGYSVYARSNINPRRSVKHQHTHLIKIAAKHPRLSFYLRKPYILINL